MTEQKDDGQPSTLQKAEELAFPVMAALIGIGYTIAILVNNPLEKVAASPHAWLLIALFIGIAAFPLRTLARHLLNRGGGQAQ